MIENATKNNETKNVAAYQEFVFRMVRDDERIRREKENKKVIILSFFLLRFHHSYPIWRV
jgi:hypothetical protein